MIGRDEFFRCPVRVAARAGQAPAAGQRRPRRAHRLDGLDGPQLRRRQGEPRLGRLDDHRRHPGPPVLGSLCRSRAVQRLARPGLRRCHPLPHARLSPVQPLLHRHSLGPREGRRKRGAPAARRVAPPRCQRAAARRAAAPRDRAFAAGGAPACVRRLLLVRALLHLRPRPGWRGAVPHGRAREPLLGLSQRAGRGHRQRTLDGALDAPLPSARPHPGPAHRLGLCGCRQLRGSRQLLASRFGLVEARQRRRDPVGGRRRRGRAPGRRLGTRPHARPRQDLRGRGHAGARCGRRFDTGCGCRCSATCAASSAWSGARWCCGCCSSPCFRSPNLIG